jgi:hypothetical protein
MLDLRLRFWYLLKKEFMILPRSVCDWKKIELKKFEKNLEDKNITINIFYDLSEESRRDDCDIYKITIYLIIMKFSFFPKYENPRDIFFFIKYIKIAENP